MEPNALASWMPVATMVTALAAVVYTVGSLMLWWTTRQSVEAMRAAFTLNFLLAYSDAGGSSGIMRMIAAMGDKTAMRERLHAQALDRILKKAFPKEYEEMRAAMREPQGG